MDDNIKLYNLLTKGKHDDIEKNILNEIYKVATYCTQIIGEGAFGRVSVPSVGPFLAVRIGEEIVVLPLVVKESKHNGFIYVDKLEKHLIISSSDDLTCEALMLFILSKDWYKGYNLHLPFLLGMGACKSNIKGITHIMLEKCGLDQKIVWIDHFKFVGNPITLEYPQNRTSSLSTIGQLIDYINVNIGQDLMCKLPNNSVIHVPDFLDSMFIFYLHTSNYLWEKYKMTLGDQHVDNLFVHWINKTSRCGKIKLDNLQTITYDIGNNKFLRIDTHGILFKIGDVGICTMCVQDDVIIVGNLTNGERLKEVLNYKTKKYCFWEYILNMYSFCPCLVAETIMAKILKKYNIGTKCVERLGIKMEFLNDIPSENDILNDELYDKFKVTKPNENETNFTVYSKTN